MYSKDVVEHQIWYLELYITVHNGRITLTCLMLLILQETVIRKRVLMIGMCIVYSGMLKTSKFIVMENAISSVHMLSGFQVQTEEMHTHHLTRDFILF